MDRRENVTAKDLELLNVALDNALSLTEQVEFDRRLTESPHLNTLLQEQKQLKAVLAQLPVRKVPHNFTLTRAEARQAKQRGIFQPLFGWASVISTLVLALVFGSELIFKNLGASAPAMTESAQTYLLEEEAPVAMQAEDAQPKIASSDEVYLLNWGAGGIGGAGGMGGGGSDEVPSSFTIDIFVPEMVSAAERPAEEGYMMNETPPDDMITEVFPETVPEDIPEDLLPTEAEPLELTQTEEQLTITSEDLPSEPPVLYGINPELTGTIVSLRPDPSEFSAEVPAAQAPSEGVLREPPAASQPVKIALFAMAVLFAAIWFFLKFKR